ncbi:MAG: M15 family metallopeptidase [Bacteroidota bacterium]
MRNLIASTNVILVALILCNCENSNFQAIQQNEESQEYNTELETDPDSVRVVPLPPHIDSLLNLDFIRGRFEPSKHPQFERVDDRYTDGDGSYYLHRDAYSAFRKMHKAAATDGIDLFIISATRNFNRQKTIWEAKWRGQRLLEGRDKANVVYPDPVERALAILRYSSMPGTSRHHWGTDLDINSLNNRYFKSGQGEKVYNWMVAHAAEHDFCQTYTAGRPYGYQEERWHWSYLPVAQPLTEYAKANAKDSDIEGFEGAETAEEIKVVERYILGINHVCLE